MRRRQASQRWRTGAAPWLASALALTTACTPHDDESEPPAAYDDEPPAIVREAEPEIPLPPLVAPPLPELAPTRPLANLAILWRHTEHDGSPPTTLWPVGTVAVSMREADAKLLGLSGPPVDAAKLEARNWRYEQAGPLTLALSDTVFVALEQGTSGVRWRTPEVANAYSYHQSVSPHALVASFYRSEGDFIVAWALDDGSRLWLHDGGGGTSFSRVRELWTDDARGYVVSDRGFEAFDPVDGSSLWTLPFDDECGLVSGEGLVVVEDIGGHLIYDASTGKQRGKLEPNGATRCGWEDYEEIGVAPAVLAGGRLYAFDSEPKYGNLSPLRAFDLATGDELWKATGFGDDLIAADHDAVLVVGDNHVLIALHADTGKPAAEISIGAGFGVRVEPVGGAAGPLMIVYDDAGGTWILGRTEQPEAPEDYVIRGTLVDEGTLSKDRIAGVKLYVGNHAVKTDKRGKFVAKGRARGAIRVETREDYDENRWTTVGIDGRRVMLDGSGSYDLGDVAAYEVSME